jgi:hypothetical protein
MPVYEETKQQVEKTYNSCVSYFKRVFQNQKKKNKEMNENSSKLIGNISESYEQLYQMSSMIQKSDPKIKSGGELKDSLQFYYEQTTAPKMMNFIVILELLQIVLESFVMVLKEENGQISKEKVEKTLKKLQETQNLADKDLEMNIVTTVTNNTTTTGSGTSSMITTAKKLENLKLETEIEKKENEKNVSFFGTKYGKKIIDPEISQKLFEQYDANYVLFGSQENTLKVIVSNEQTKSRIEKDFDNKIEVEVGESEKIQSYKLCGIKASGKEEGSSESDGTIGFILESKNGYYALTSAHTLLKVKKDAPHGDYLQAFIQNEKYNDIQCKVLGVTFQVDISDVFVVFDDDVDVALIPIPDCELVPKLNEKYKFPIEFNKSNLEEMKPMSVVKYGKSTGRTIGKLVGFGNSADFKKSILYFF